MKVEPKAQALALLSCVEAELVLHGEAKAREAAMLAMAMMELLLVVEAVAATRFPSNPIPRRASIADGNGKGKEPRREGEQEGASSSFFGLSCCQ